jgi:guanylate kinase
MDNHPPIIIISGATGSGKGTVLHALEKEMAMVWVPTHTTRPVRQDDSVLSHRIFDTETNFIRYLSRGEFVEATELAGYRYGLLRADLEKQLRVDKPVILEVSVEGGLEIERQYPNTLLCFLTAPEKERLARIKSRGDDTQEIDQRLEDDKHEEKLAHDHYHYMIENPHDHPEQAIEAVKELIQKHCESQTTASKAPN